MLSGVSQLQLHVACVLTIISAGRIPAASTMGSWSAGRRHKALAIPAVAAARSANVDPLDHVHFAIGSETPGIADVTSERCWVQTAGQGVGLSTMDRTSAIDCICFRKQRARY